MDHDRAFVGSDDSDLVEVAGTIGADEHRHSLVEVFDENRVVEGVDGRAFSHYRRFVAGSQVTLP